MGIIFVLLIICIILFLKNIERKKKEILYSQDISKLKEQINFLNEKEKELNLIRQELEISLDKVKKELEKRLNPDEEFIGQLKEQINDLQNRKDFIMTYLHNNEHILLDIQEKEVLLEDLTKKEIAQKNKINKLKNIFKSIKYSIDNFYKNQYSANEFSDDIIPTDTIVELKLHHMDFKELNKLFKKNKKDIEDVLNSYEQRYTTKSNKNIYNLMVVALQAELQNILYDLKYGTLEKGIDDVKKITQKYLKLAESGNQTIANTLVSFIGQIEYLFINAVKIEYNYYVKKEQARQEQLAIRQQMREEAEERRLLKLEQERIEAEEQKYKLELERTKELIQTAATEEEKENLNKRMMELEIQLSDVVLKKDEIVNIQNGKAGNVYIISNLGSFGDNVFKIGMTRRIDPQERINELGSASVPFKFDVHSFIFSEDAVTLENELHKRLDNNRVNKVNLRKEFFKCNIDDLEKLVTELDPTAEFNKTMLAEEFYQSLSSEENYNTIIEESEDDIDDDIIGTEEN